jgi:hypothetical protein
VQLDGILFESTPFIHVSTKRSPYLGREKEKEIERERE